MMWADTSLVGCARMNYNGGTNLNICNYGPSGNKQLFVVMYYNFKKRCLIQICCNSGNWIGTGPYKTGVKAASACTAGVSTTYPGLCN